MVSDYNAVRFTHFFLPECYISIVTSMVFFTALFMLGYYVLMPKFIHPRFDHIKTNPLLDWKIVDSSVAMIHGLFILFLCIIFHDVLFLNVTRNITDSYTAFEERTIASVSIGYFVYDLFVVSCIFSKKHIGRFDYIIILHHVIAITGLMVVVITVYSGKLTITALFLSEISNPILHAVNLRNKFTPREMVGKRLIVTKIAGRVLYILIFCFARFVCLGHIVYQITIEFECSVYIQITAVLLLLLSVLLLPAQFKDLHKAYRKYVTIRDENHETSANNVSAPNIEQQYNDVLSLSKQSVVQFFVAGTVYSFFHTNRMAVYVLYANEFNPTAMQIAFLLYGYSFWSGLASLLYGALANQYGYDLMLTLLLMVQCVAVLLESVATSFYVLFSGIMLGQVVITYIVFGYIAWILPHEVAKVYTSYFYGTFMVSYLVGPISAGFVSFYLSNRTVFVINCVLCFFALIHSLIFIWRTEAKLKSKQLLIGLVHGKEDDEQFPICMNVNANAGPYENKWYKVPQLSSYEWFMLLCILFINSSVSVGESAFVVYYSLYVVQVLRSNVIVGTCGILILSVAFIIGNLVVPKWINPNEDSKCKLIKDKYFVMILCLMVLILHMVYLFPFNRTIPMYCVFDFTCGFAIGVLSMASEIIILEVQPTEDSGKVSGAKGLIRNWLIAVASLIIALWWDREPNSLYFVLAASFGIALLLTLAMVAAKWLMKRKRKENSVQRMVSIQEHRVLLQDSEMSESATANKDKMQRQREQKR
eukprot:203053_1